MSVLSEKYMYDEAAAFAHVESKLWPDGPVCPHCGVVDSAYRLTGVRTKPSKKNPEGKERHGLWKCRDCRGQFTVRKGTIFEESHLPLHLWLQAIHLMVSSKKGISSHQLHRILGITYKSAWFLTHRIRECMRDGALAGFGGGGGIVEVDETFIGKEPGVKKAENARGGSHKMKVLTLVDRETHRAKSIVVDDMKKSTLIPILRENIAREAYVMTDEARHYQNLGAGRVFDAHGWTNHGAGEYVGREDPEIHTNTVEGYFSIFKRGMKGVYQHCGKQHLHRYAAEFDFRYNHREANGVDDAERGQVALRGAVGKRLTYVH
ncbi:IS1595 family transposase [Roseobacter sp. HKCCD9010]|uniref:IS1595 family transposase n=1 Tax=unclassified Roseobacter TaxID=196798 RepID=UPI00149253F1|nr:IS1595 family transposase [Rhodobacterales bacterium HKCCD4356]NNV14491.1 IS1595 family transposase [Roseobacter sp. HKCCD7357]NNV18774.1 IS1595 family transposase [Roseobacter sp. HKCCD8768]NNV28201.1 IS1595 family transposase [Roseobacter sp. HKCCD8192]NNV32485.1 IS1595 family transposase [Roseobacter sp. HKCCD9061]NNV36529.1 IS1595 family transposase [Roseobacter sp. HKCCD9073]NNV40621.1 IS1595 family transposase [Roseobacter sp. HKCCD9054]NNV45233.1 IS1595 family transposase [Roseobac